MGFPVEDLSTPESRTMWDSWKQRSCQPNFWAHVQPPSSETCGPYRPEENLVPSDAADAPSKEREFLRAAVEETVPGLEKSSQRGGCQEGEDCGGEGSGVELGGRKMKLAGEGRSRIGWGKGVEKWDVDDR